MLKFKKLLKEDEFKLTNPSNKDDMSVLTEEDFDNLSPEIQKVWEGYDMTMAYEIISWSEEEDSEDYEEDRGWEIEEPQNFKSLEELCKQVGYDATWLEWSSSHLTGDEWIMSAEDTGSREYFEKGEHKTYNLFIKRADGEKLNKEEMEYIHGELGLHGRANYVG